jgi:hypothetical protein
MRVSNGAADLQIGLTRVSNGGADLQVGLTPASNGGADLQVGLTRADLKVRPSICNFELLASHFKLSMA